MPVQGRLFVPDDAPYAVWRRLEECPGIRRLREPRSPRSAGSLEVTAPALASRDGFDDPIWTGAARRPSPGVASGGRSDRSATLLRDVDPRR